MSKPMQAVIAKIAASNHAAMDTAVSLHPAMWNAKLNLFVDTDRHG